LGEIDTHLAKREEYKSMNPKDVLERNKLNEKIETGLGEVRGKLEELDVILKSQKNKPKKFGDVSNKEEMKRLMDERYRLLRNKFEGVPVDDREVKDNRTLMERMDELLTKRAENAQPEREMYDVERNALGEFKAKINEQDKGLDELHTNVKVFGAEVKKINRGIENVGAAAQSVSRKAAETEKKLETTNSKLKDLLGKLRSGDKICVDIILICICLGLIAVLYNIIKSKFFSSSTTTATTTPAKTFLMY
jgi:chromosome segregation ATPase